MTLRKEYYEILGVKYGTSSEGHLDGVSSVVISPDGKKIISGSFEGKIKIWRSTI